ncbi:L-asparaginase II [Colletotrichum godetiae]|uniref:L-asparaginase II n=1 Tax=Colletotrichum godetiae TaxID=1209918 RepID=A0AAJ0ALM8_9PEZI|nr:L-asparaginase II [Colletotrichum godetiae]KAK1676188.1 L-asparaginase II [Colletotrichum godetiae]
MTKTSLFEDYVVTDRGGVIENRHAVHAAVVDVSGKILYAVGNPSRMTLARSASKPAQALAMLETPGFEKYGFDGADVALMCASHNSEDRHVSRARSMLSKVGAQESDLRCGGHPSICPVVDKSWIRAGFTPMEINSNCSGKHAGMLGGAKALGASFEGYHLPHHPMQVKVKQVVEDLSGLSGDEIKWAIDGCNLPAPGQPLYSMGCMYAAFAAAADAIDRGDAVHSTRTKHMADIYNAMSTYPEMVGGEGRFCTVLMGAFEGGLFGKVGADGCYTIGIRASEATKELGAEGAVGIAVKIEDGSLEILYAAVPEILDQLRIGTPEMRRKLASFHHLKRVNTMGVETGQVSHAFNVRRVI